MDSRKAKKIHLSQLLHRLDELLLPKQFNDSALNGLQVEGREDIQKIGVAVTASKAVIERAIEESCDALIVHHGLLWKGDLQPIKSCFAERLRLLLSHKISLIAYHLPLDGHPKIGNNWKTALDLGWKNLLPFGIINGQFLGVKGSLAPITVKEFEKKLALYFGHKATTALFGKEKISSAAFLSGGAHHWLQEAIDAKVDAYVTGNFDEPAWWLAKEGRINFLAYGHNATEKTGPQAIKEFVQSTFSVKTLFLDIENPF